jgi:transposase
MKRAQILLKAAEGWRDEAIMQALTTSRSTVERTRRRFVEGGLDRALNEDARPGQARKLDGRGEAQLIALACSERPDNRQARWSLRLLAEKWVELGVVEHISYETVRQTIRTFALPVQDGSDIGVNVVMRYCGWHDHQASVYRVSTE